MKILKVLLLLLVLSGCGSTSTESKRYFQVLERYDDGIVLVDTSTGIMYYSYARSGGHVSGITPIYKTDGSIFTYDEYLAEHK